MNLSADQRESLVNEACALIRQALRFRRWMWLALGGILALCGLLGFVMVTIAAKGQERLALMIVFFVAALLPAGFLLRTGLKPLSKHALIKIVISEPKQITAINLGYIAGLFGYRASVSINVAGGRCFYLNLPADSAKKLAEILGKLT